MHVSLCSLSQYFCIDKSLDREWKVWKNGDGMNKTLRSHLMVHHHDLWKAVCRVEHLKIPQAICLPLERNGVDSMPEFTLGGFEERLVRWIIADDQVCTCLLCMHSAVRSAHFSTFSH